MDGVSFFFFLFFPENRIDILCCKLSLGDNLHEMSKPVFEGGGGGGVGAGREEHDFNMSAAEILPRALFVKLLS